MRDEERRLVWVALGGAGFLTCMLLSAGLYPGGVWNDPRTEGHSFWGNYWCDLLSPVAIGGGDHALGAWLARLGFVSFSVTLWLFWPVAASIAEASPLGAVRGRARLARGMGRVAALALLGVSAVPAARSPLVHAVFVSVSAGAGIVAALALIPVLSARVDTATRWLSWCVVAACLVPLLQYLRQGITGANYADWLAGAQKIATGLTLVWMTRLLWWARIPPRQESERVHRGRPAA